MNDYRYILRAGSAGYVIAVVCLAAAIAAYCSGCGGGPRDVARGTVNAGGVVLAEVDARTAVVYRDTAARALRDAATLVEYRRAMEPLDEVVRAMEVCADVLRTLDYLVEMWDVVGAGRWAEAFGHAVQAFERLLAVLRVAGIEPPDALYDWLVTATTSPTRHIDGSAPALPED